MALRSHVGRPFDLGLWSNRLLFLMVAGFGVAAMVSWVNGSAVDVLWTPAHLFVAWALLRELDPDHEWSALIAGVGTGVWILAGYPVSSALAVGGLMLAARIVLNSTGRRPLLTDLAFLAAYATAISFSRTGWVAGFGLAVAIYVDGRIAEGANTASAATAGLAALGASVVATAAGAFPNQVLHIRPIAISLIGVVALVTIARPPPEPVGVVDSRMKWRLSRDRLHAARAMVGILVFASALLSGGEVERLAPLVAALVISLVAAEVERMRRRL